MDTPMSPVSSEYLKTESDSVAAYTLAFPNKHTSPLIFASPHSGRHYPQSFINQARLDSQSLRRSEDAFIDELYEKCVEFGIPFLKATYPRSFLDLNREPFELDQNMFQDELPSYVNNKSARAIAGLGTVARIVAKGVNIYKSKLRFEEAFDRINHIYLPYHQTLNSLITQCKTEFGVCLLIDCHSMPSSEAKTGLSFVDPSSDIILGDRFGTSCDTWISDFVHRSLEECGFIVTRNRPYAGGYTTEHYGHPVDNTHAIQIELNRACYMNEKTIEKSDRFLETQEKLNCFIEKMSQIQFIR